MMQVRHASLPALLLFAFLGCRSGGVSGFRFESGGSHHLEGHGAWTVSVDSARRLTASHDVRGDVREYGPAALSDADAVRLRAAIDAVSWSGLGAAGRPLVPGEVVFSFTVDGRTYDVPSNDLDGRLDELVRLLERLVAETLRPPEPPVLR